MDLGSPPPPQVVSDTYALRGSADDDPHWDLHFIYNVTGPPLAPRSPLWRDLEYVAVRSTPRAAFGRGHGDILELVGLTPQE